MPSKPTTYWDYIKVEELLSLQGGIEADDAALVNDEVMFIVIHQIDELWFKLTLRELVGIRDLFAQEHVAEQSLSSVVRGLRRTVLLLQQVAHHFELMETLTTRDYLAFRDKLSPASGFQSAQLREIEILLGLESRDRIPLGHEDYMRALQNADGSPSPASRRVTARLADRPSLREALDDWLYRTPIDGSVPEDEGDAAHVRAVIEAFIDAHARELDAARTRAMQDALTEGDRERLDARYRKEIASARTFLLAEDLPEDTSEPERQRRSRIRAALLFIESYRELPLLAWPREVLDAIVALEQAFVIFRQRHARMVERIIGRRTGTGGSAGVEYLDQTALLYRVFRDVWAVRTLLLRSAALPELGNADYYGFAEGHP
ncbi:tryptophan 2,3-dioxygenase [Pseudenhygromyxa sp. WMMC2535]|uniref:tryptophan 2,3-dioxygenase family protein n=1 Tax=Pseudenhygromyxa sp. WMMC2535 TaxID=2712867 RepID=UPI001553CD1D|nr:tryptophan 2,3-dioxygenase family protein [Pseudenhygromyxa sp. WMMC2535]NVB37999.1 tryptophan 2,3-dioxygenase [Pseudenhygromyxa sp. WMMC2535]